MLILEVGIKLDKDVNYYDELLRNNGFNRIFETKIHDLYYTNQNLDGLTENEMKTACIRIRGFGNEPYKVQNKLLGEVTTQRVFQDELQEFESELAKYGYKRVFDTFKDDYHYTKPGMTNRIQLQQIKDIGLLVYYDNSDYYEYDLETQRRKLIDDLNSFGFNFDYNVLGVDKLRTLYYHKEMYSKNQNG